jgi:hypothetical protein
VDIAQSWSDVSVGGVVRGMLVQRWVPVGYLSRCQGRIRLLHGDRLSSGRRCHHVRRLGVVRGAERWKSGSHAGVTEKRRAGAGHEERWKSVEGVRWQSGGVARDGPKLPTAHDDYGDGARWLRRRLSLCGSDLRQSLGGAKRGWGR